MICPVCDVSNFVSFRAGGLRCNGCGCIARDAGSASIHTATAPEAHFRRILHARGLREERLLVLNQAVPEAPQSPAEYEGAMVLNVLENHPAPGQLLKRLHRAMRPGAPLLLAVSKGRWGFDENTLHLLLSRYGFHEILTRREAAGLVATATRCQPAPRPQYSIIVAAYNERRTFCAVMDALLAKTTPGVDREIIVVESNSTDGTRELAKGYENQPGVKLIFQDKARGKGHAIREGLQHAIGDIILIQDADLEYDLQDYDDLLAPILAHRTSFVLGTRHSGDWKMRRFAQQRLLTLGMNLGHALFTGLLNILYRQHMTDPFTMFKVFRRDCLFGLVFESNRFDFDHELVIKLIRKGYRPMEVPVNYCSRSFHEGKKVRPFRDPLTWLWADLKFRFVRVLPRIPD